MKLQWILLRHRESGTYDEDSLDLIAQQLTDWEGNQDEIDKWVSEILNQPIGKVVTYPQFRLIKVYDVSS